MNSCTACSREIYDVSVADHQKMSANTRHHDTVLVATHNHVSDTGMRDLVSVSGDFELAKSGLLDVAIGEPPHIVANAIVRKSFGHQFSLSNIIRKRNFEKNDICCADEYKAVIMKKV